MFSPHSEIRGPVEFFYPVNTMCVILLYQQDFMHILGCNLSFLLRTQLHCKHVAVFCLWRLVFLCPSRLTALLSQEDGASDGFLRG